MNPFNNEQRQTSKVNDLLVTGLYRSGTTLLSKLLHMHRDVVMADQPFALFYVFVKSEFNNKIAIRRIYPLHHLFLEDGYSQEMFSQFLDEYIVTKENLRIIFSDLKDYPGLRTPEILSLAEKIKSGTFLEVFHQLNSFLREILNKQNAVWSGGKDNLCEEYAPYLASKGIKTIFVIRDPRDVVASDSFNTSHNYNGAHRPVLFTLRAWRKSVAFALALKESPHFLWLKYEDLVSEPMRILNSITKFLNICPFTDNDFNNGVCNQDGTLWKGNSSFNNQLGISNAPAGRYKKILPAHVLKYIESCCLPEMKYLGYEFAETAVFDEDIITEFREPFIVDHPSFRKNYSFSPEHIDQEILRYRKLSDPHGALTEKEAKQWFLYEENYRKLRGALR